MSVSTTTTAASNPSLLVPPQEQLRFLSQRMPWITPLLRSPKGLDFLERFSSQHKLYQWTPLMYQDLYQFLLSPHNQKKVDLLLHPTLTESEKKELDAFLSDFLTTSFSLTFDEKTIGKVLLDMGSSLAKEGKTIQEIPKLALESALKVYRVSITISPLNLISPHRVFIESIDANLRKLAENIKTKLECAHAEIIEAWKGGLSASPLFDKSKLVAQQGGGGSLESSKRGSSSNPNEGEINQLSIGLSNAEPWMSATPDMITDLPRGLFYRNSVSVMKGTQIKVLFQKRNAAPDFFPELEQELRRQKDLQKYKEELKNLFETLDCDEPLLCMGMATLLFTQSLSNKLIGSLVPCFVTEEGMRIDTKNSENSFLFSKTQNPKLILVDLIVSVPLENPGLVIKTYFSFKLESDGSTVCALSDRRCSQMLVQGGGYIVPVFPFSQQSI
jgi:hypothetical protein